MNEILNCRFLTTAQNQSDEDIAPSELNSQLHEFIEQASALLCGRPYLEVSDTYDSLQMAFDKVVARKNRTDRGSGQRCSTQSRSVSES